MSSNKICKSAPVIGYWMSERKSKKLNWSEFGKVCLENGYELIKIDLGKPLEDQGPFAAIVHKLTDFIVRDDAEATSIIRSFEDYFAKHPEVAVIDPFEGIRILADRYESYRLIRNSELDCIGVFTPTFVHLQTSDVVENIKKLEASGVRYPFICKPYVAHGTDECHKMALIFNEKGVEDCKPPCVAQTFVNHNAVLFKVFVVGDTYQVVERPSLKNFKASPDHGTIFFDSHTISKSDSASELSLLDHDDNFTPHDPSSVGNSQILDPEKLSAIVSSLKIELNMALFGVDIVVENDTGRYAIIDINVYPGYDGFPDFFCALMKCILKKVKCSRHAHHVYANGGVKKEEPVDSGFDTCGSTD